MLAPTRAISAVSRAIPPGRSETLCCKKEAVVKRGGGRIQPGKMICVWDVVVLVVAAGGRPCHKADQAVVGSQASIQDPSTRQTARVIVVATRSHIGMIHTCRVRSRRCSRRTAPCTRACPPARAACRPAAPPSPRPRHPQQHTSPTGQVSLQMSVWWILTAIRPADQRSQR